MIDPACQENSLKALSIRSSWIRGESNPCPKTHPVSFYYHSSLLLSEDISRVKKENEHALFVGSRSYARRAAADSVSFPVILTPYLTRTGASQATLVRLGSQSYFVRISVYI